MRSNWITLKDNFTIRVIERKGIKNLRVLCLLEFVSDACAIVFCYEYLELSLASIGVRCTYHNIMTIFQRGVDRGHEALHLGTF